MPVPGVTGCDFRHVELSVETIEGENEPVLMRRITTNLLASSGIVVREQVLCRRVKLFNVSYYDGSVWQDTWESSGQDNLVPLAAEVTLEFFPEKKQSIEAPQSYRISRVFRIPCGRSAQTTESGAAPAEPAGAQN